MKQFFNYDNVSAIEKQSPRSLGEHLGNIGSAVLRRFDGPFEPTGLPTAVLPILEYMKETEPHIVVACDRGGRLPGVALKAAWAHTQETPFPTLDTKLHFARISRSEDFASMQTRIKSILATSHANNRQSTKALSDFDALRMLFIDDWSVSGQTRELVQRLAAEHGATASLAVLCGNKSDFSAKPHIPSAIGSLTTWRNSPREIGVDYSTSTLNTAAVALHTLESARNRREIHASAKRLAIDSAGIEFPAESLH